MDIHVDLIDDPPAAAAAVPQTHSARRVDEEEPAGPPPQVQKSDSLAPDEVLYKPVFDLGQRSAEEEESLAIAARTAPERLRIMWDRWFPGRAPGESMWDCDQNITDMFSTIGIDRKERITPDQVNQKFKVSLSSVSELMLELERSGELRLENNESMIRLILQKMEATRIVLLGMYKLCIADTMIPSDLPRGDFGLWRFIPPSADDDDEKPSPQLRLRMFTINDTMHWGYRRYRDAFMVRINSHDGHATCSWRLAITIEDYVRSLTSRRLTDTKVWFDLASGQGTSTAEGLVKWLKYSDDAEVPWIEPDRHVFGFRNGVFLADQEKFIPYNRLPEFYSKESYPVACRHFDSDFDIHWLELDDPMMIPTPAINQIFVTQKLSPDVVRWSWALFGRLLYNVGEHDDWQILPFIKGLANTGKSCLLKFLAKIYDPQDVAYVSNMFEKQFGLGQVAGKFITIADDLRADFQMDQSDFQNITSGNAILVAVKHKEPRIVDPWTTPMVFSGNTVPGYHDNSGSYGRRVAVIAFLQSVLCPDGSLARRMMLEMPAFLVKANWQYRNMVRRYGDAGIWTILPEEFMAQRASLTETSNALVGFLASGLIKKGDGLYMPLNTLRDAVMAHAMRNNIEKPKWGSDYYMGPLTSEGLAVGGSRQKRRYPRYTTQSVGPELFIYGCDLQANCKESPPPVSSSSSGSGPSEGGRGDAPVLTHATRSRPTITSPPRCFPPSH